MDNTDLGNERVAETRDRTAHLVQGPVDQAKEQGVVPPDLEQSGLILVQAAPSAVMDRSRVARGAT